MTIARTLRSKTWYIDYICEMICQFMMQDWFYFRIIYFSVPELRHQQQGIYLETMAEHNF